jgi:hypothetical protein
MNAKWRAAPGTGKVVLPPGRMVNPDFPKDEDLEY